MDLYVHQHDPYSENECVLCCSSPLSTDKLKAEAEALEEEKGKKQVG